ncbi:MAG TPA: ATP-binding protein [Gemmatimonadaceae bacterium]|nr:ATP-binding protein [Gemmatimonadaceae bacterium]
MSEAPLILVADDVPGNVELLVDQLTTLGFRTVTAFDGPGALEACFAHRPQLCILDVTMPAGDLGVEANTTGFEVCRRIKHDPRTARTPVIFLTALNDTMDRVQAIEAGGEDFLTKPHNSLLLGARVRSLVRLKSTTDALEESYRKLRELEHVREDLMRMVVHDLKTPLTTILATLELLGDGDFGALDERQLQAVRETEDKAEELLSLIDEILEIRRMESAEIALDLHPLSPNQLLTEITHDWSRRLERDEAQALVDVADEAPVFRGDPKLLKRVLGNLLENALTHGGRGVRTILSARRDAGGIRFIVTDNGPGVPREEREHIFKSFTSVRRSASARSRGTGLGLAFCRLAVAAHGGRIWVEDGAEMKGSAFHIVLPLDPSASIRNGRPAA